MGPRPVVEFRSRNHWLINPMVVIENQSVEFCSAEWADSNYRDLSISENVIWRPSSASKGRNRVFRPLSSLNLCRDAKYTSQSSFEFQSLDNKLKDARSDLITGAIGKWVRSLKRSKSSDSCFFVSRKVYWYLSAMLTNSLNGISLQSIPTFSKKVLRSFGIVLAQRINSMLFSGNCPFSRQ